MKAHKKHIIRLLSIGLLLATISLPAAGQTAKSGYFLPGMLNRNKLNPAIMNSQGYVGIPILSNLNIGIKTNMGVGKFVFPMANGGLTTFMNSSVSAKEFLSGISNVNTLNADFSTDIIGFGFKAGKSYNTAGLSLRSVSGANIPYALFDFMKSGMSSPNVNHYSIKNLEFQTTNYAELFYGYSRPINDQWTVGGKVKFLVGLADIKARISQMDISMSADEWLVSSQGYMDASTIVPTHFTTDADGSIAGYEFDDNSTNISSFGFAVDLGAVYKPADRWTVSLGVTDLGFIKWDGNISAQTNAEPFRFSGFNDVGDGDINGQLDDLQNQLKDLILFYPNNQAQSSRTSALKATINIGGEYEIVEDLFSVGVLSSTRIGPVFTLTEAIISANYRPSDSWFNAALTLDISNVAVSGGFIINFCPSFLNFFVGADFILYRMTPQFIPMRSAAPTFSLGLNIPIGHR